jgi:hypothetical protein
MIAAFVARLTVSAVAAGQGMVPVFVDLNRTHATNSLWPGHARFHVVYQVFTLLPAAVIEVALVWWPGPGMRVRFYVAALFSATSLAGFLIAAVARSLYGGTLRDSNGIPPVRLQLGSRALVFDANLPLVILGAVLLGAAVMVFRLS